MESQLKQSELERHRAIIQATLDYLLECFGGRIVFDQIDPMTEYYQQQKIQTEKYYKQRRVDKLQQQLERLTKGLQNADNLNFTSYIKARTGYDIDIFEDLRKRVDTIISQTEIRSEKEFSEILMMLHYYRQTSANKEVAEKLEALISNYDATRRKRKNDHSHVISSIQNDGLVIVKAMSYTGHKLKHYEEQELISPDGKRRFTVTQQGFSKHASTSVLIAFPKESGIIYDTNGLLPDIKAFWKDNQTIVIETRRAYIANTQYKQMRSFDDVIDIEYIEN